MIMMINLEKQSESSGKLLELSDVCGPKYNVAPASFLPDSLWSSQTKSHWVSWLSFCWCSVWSVDQQYQYHLWAC